MNSLVLIAFLATVPNQADEPKPVATLSISQLFDAAGKPGGLEPIFGKYYRFTGVTALNRTDYGTVASFTLTSYPVPEALSGRSVFGIGSAFPGKRLACLLPEAETTVYATVVRETVHGSYHLQIVKAECDKREGAVPVKCIALSTIAGAAAIGLDRFLEAKKRPDGTLEPPPTTSTPSVVP